MSDEVVAESGAGAVRPSAGPEGSEPRRKRGVLGSRRALAVSAVLGLVVGAGAVATAWALSGTSDGGAGTFTLVGRIRIAGAPGQAGTCSGDGPWSDVDKGALVTVYDSGGLVVATGTLGTGAYDDAAACTFPVIVRNVPDDSKSYGVRVGWHPRKDITNEVARTGELVQMLE
ncbi:hypothetical protein [Streptomyces sp. NPDC048200]|uniref:hypothetical protein n=1 Tax=Streptomyces sp. NPDC048200 TaxID=3365512 RepID=UPI003720FEBE